MISWLGFYGGKVNVSLEKLCSCVVDTWRFSIFFSGVFLASLILALVGSDVSISSISSGAPILGMLTGLLGFSLLSTSFLKVLILPLGFAFFITKDVTILVLYCGTVHLSLATQYLSPGMCCWRAAFSDSLAIFLFQRRLFILTCPLISVFISFSIHPAISILVSLILHRLAST